MTNWGIPIVPLSEGSVSSGPAVTGDVIDFGEIRDMHAATFTVTDFSGSGTIAADLNGSLDGESWYTLANIPGGISGNGVVFNATTNPAPARYVQAFAEVFGGSPSATVTVTSVSGIS
jgi:hypothetical protein